MGKGIYHRSEKRREELREAARQMSKAPRGEQWRQKQREGKIGRKHGEEWSKKISLALKGRKWTLEERLSHKSIKGRKHSLKTRESISIAVKRKWLNNEFREKMIKALTGRKMPESFRHHARIRAIKNLKGRWKRPTNIEIRLTNILNRRFPGEWKYVGNGQFVIGGKFPDFINVNGKKQVIELFGNYWHNALDSARKEYHYSQYGFSCLVIWEDELDNVGALIRKVRRFK